MRSPADRLRMASPAPSLGIEDRRRPDRKRVARSLLDLDDPLAVVPGELTTSVVRDEVLSGREGRPGPDPSIVIDRARVVGEEPETVRSERSGRRRLPGSAHTEHEQRGSGGQHESRPVQRLEAHQRKDQGEDRQDERGGGLILVDRADRYVDGPFTRVDGVLRVLIPSDPEASLGFRSSSTRALGRIRVPAEDGPRCVPGIGPVAWEIHDPHAEAPGGAPMLIGTGGQSAGLRGSADGPVRTCPTRGSSSRSCLRRCPSA